MEDKTKNFTVFVPVDYDKLKNKKVKIVPLITLIVNSHYDPQLDARVAKKEDINYSKLEKENQNLGKTRKTIRNNFMNLTKYYSDVVEFNDEKQEFIIRNSNANFTASIPYKTLEIMATCMNEIVLRVYFFLYRQYLYWAVVKHMDGFDFTITQLVEGIGYNSSKAENRTKVKNALNLLHQSNILNYNIVKKGAGYYRRLTGIRDNFSVISFEDEIEESIQGEEYDEIPQTDEPEEIIYTGIDIDNIIFSYTYGNRKIETSFKDLRRTLSISKPESCQVYIDLVMENKDNMPLIEQTGIDNLFPQYDWTVK